VDVIGPRDVTGLTEDAWRTLLYDEVRGTSRRLATLDRHAEQTDRRVSTLEHWRSYMNGGLGLACFLLAGLGLGHYLLGWFK